MDQHDILTRVEHTILKPHATWAQVQDICDEGLWGQVATICLPPTFVAQGVAYLAGRLPLCTVIGFPHGNATTAVKAFEATEALAAGAQDVDMVINLSWVKDGRWSNIATELHTMRKASQGAILKVIVETCLLQASEKLRLCHLISESGADYIKTSTGFSTEGATVDDVALFRRTIAPHVNIKASGGIRSFAFAKALVEAGADRLGSSALVALAKKDMDPSQQKPV